AYKQHAQATEEALQQRLESQVRSYEAKIDELEQAARRREWLIGTIVALVVGVASILISHFGLGM
ncbi:hypothetical protein, partial [Salmonella sp. SAL04269]|uniref:hypothetical protein n=1 Tax=Salmonella sp. SAL04269 TaxID=3159847 RepID=UPI00397E76ED